MLRKWWPLILLLVLQVGSLVLMSRRSASALMAGFEITLKTEAVDPFDPLAGRFVTLRYQVEGAESLDPEPFEVGDEVFIIVERDFPVWTARGVTRKPVPFSQDVLALRAVWRVEWGTGRAVIPNAGRLYMAEALCLEADELLRLAPNDAIVTLSVDESGNATPIKLDVAGRLFP